MSKRVVLMLLAGAALTLCGCAPREKTTSAGEAPVAQTPPPAPESAEPPSPLVGKPAPAFSLTSLDGKSIDLASLKGKPVVLDFWATWCPPCRELVPSVQRIHEEMGDKLVVIAMARDDAEAVKAYAKEHGLTLTQVLAPDSVASAYGVDGIPTTVFIDKEGIVREVHVGLAPGDPYKPLKAAVDKIMGGSNST